MMKKFINILIVCCIFGFMSCISEPIHYVQPTPTYYHPLPTTVYRYQPVYVRPIPIYHPAPAPPPRKEPQPVRQPQQQTPSGKRGGR